MSKFIDTIIGDLNEKREYREAEKRAKALPAEYSEAYKDIRNYIWSTSGIVSIEPLVTLVDMLEQAASENRKVTDITGSNVAEFADELVKGIESYKDHQQEKLNKKFKNK